MKQVPYIGWTGAITRNQITEAIRMMPVNTERQLMIGLLASSKTILGVRNKFPKLYAYRKNIAGLLPSDKRVLGFIHYSSDYETDIGEQLVNIAKLYGGPNLKGFQVNMPWPDPTEIAKFKNVYPDMKIVIQLGRWAIDGTKETARGTARKAKKLYGKGLADYLILDSSMGEGKELSVNVTLMNLEAIERTSPEYSIILGGGLGPDNLPILKPILERYEVGIDAQDKVINEDARRIYFREAWQMLG